MNINSVTGLYFSPTGTTKKIIESIIAELGIINIEFIDITNIDCRNNTNRIISSDLLVIGFPVYEEHVPDQVTGYLKNVLSTTKFAVAISLYGNIGFGMSLIEINKILKEKNIKLLSTGAFIGEHSFAKKDVPLAMGRPNESDLVDSSNMARLIKERYNLGYILDENRIPGKLPLMSKILPPNSAKLFTKPPIINSNCIKCGICIKKCPMGAIQSDYTIDEVKCIRCFACVKFCKFEGRAINYKINFLVKHMLLNKNKIAKNNFYM